MTMLEHILSSPKLHVPLIREAMQQNLITCLYETELAGLCRHVTITWVKNVKGQGLCVTVDDPSCQYICKVKMNPWSFWKKQGMKSFDLCGSKVEVYWDLSSAKYLCGPEPLNGFYVAVVCNEVMVLLLGDRSHEAYKKTKAKPSVTTAQLLSRKEHIFGKKVFCTKAAFNNSGKAHDIVIECETDAPKHPAYLVVRIDRHVVVQVKNLEWKFRGNQTVIVDGIAVEIFWDVHNWLFSNGVSNAIFIFQACNAISGGPKAIINGKGDRLSAAMRWSGDLNGSISAMKLVGARSLRSDYNSTPTMDAEFNGSSLMLHAWKSE